MESKKAVAYLAKNQDQQPEEVKALFEKLEAHESGLKAIQTNIQQAQRAIEELSKQFDMKVGSIEALADAIGTLIPQDKISEWAEEFDKTPDQE